MRFCTFNVENLFLTPTQLRQPLKSAEKTQWLAHVISEIDADIYLLVEVGGVASLNEFNKRYLHDQYHTSLIKGNSERGIELGYLVHKRLTLRFEHLTHRNRPLNFLYPYQVKENKALLKKGKPIKYHSELLSRDIAELRIMDDDHKIVCILLGLHLKSKLDDKGIDFNGRLRRGSELKLVVDTYNTLNKRYKEKVPIFITGDFNGLAQSDGHEAEFSYLYQQTNLRDIADHLGWELSERATFVTFDRLKKPQPIQLDYFFIGQQWAHLIQGKECAVYRYQKENVLPLPQTSHARVELPSDHYPLVVDVSL